MHKTNQNYHLAVACVCHVYVYDLNCAVCPLYQRLGSLRLKEQNKLNCLDVLTYLARKAGSKEYKVVVMAVQEATNTVKHDCFTQTLSGREDLHNQRIFKVGAQDQQFSIEPYMKYGHSLCFGVISSQDGQICFVWEHNDVTVCHKMTFTF